MNRLADETSPYLLQHAENPVDWLPWGEEALRLARAEDRPILLSIGYSACHWCHVMAHESFEDEATAALMNELFINVKVDREERPDVDALYMDAVVALTGQGGWPMTVFLTPDGRPFYGGTYFPPEARHGLPAFRDLLRGAAEAYRDRRGDVAAAADRLVEMIRGWSRELADEEPEPAWGALLSQALEGLSARFDAQHAGFGGAPKFPPSVLLPTLLALGERPGLEVAAAMAVATLDAMAAGGIHDQLGGGFHRYAVDGRWLVPHFEKMLYDNALLADAYSAAAVATGDPRHAAVARSVLAYLERELALEGGGLASAQDADTDGVEGLSFTWTQPQVRAVLDDPVDVDLVERVYGITPGGNFEGATVLSVVRAPATAAAELGLDTGAAGQRLVSARARLLAARSSRPQPARDDKALAAWNGMALAAFANAGRRLGEPALVERARGLAVFLLGPLSSPTGDLYRSARDGRARIAGFADDYGATADGLIALHAATGELRWLAEARRLTERAVELFGADGGGFYLASAEGERLVARTKDLDDNPTPSGSSLLAACLLRLGRIYGRPDWEERAARAALVVQDQLPRAAVAFGRLLGVVDALDRPPLELAIVGALDDPRTAALRAVVDRGLRPWLAEVVAAPGDPLFETVPLLAGRSLVAGAPAAYLCEHFACLRPVTEPEELRALLG